MNAGKDRIGSKELRALFEGASEIVVAKGKKVTTVDVSKGLPPEKELAELVLGPTGNLRAPTFRIGKKWIVGFHPEVYAERFE